MKPINFYLTMLLVSGIFAPVMAQRPGRWSNYDAVSTYRIGMQGINLSELNQALQQAGYGNLPSQVPVVSVTSQFSRANKPLAVLSEFGFSLGSGVTNGTYKARAGFFYFKIGGSYSLIRSEKFQLGPQLSLISLPFHVSVEPLRNTAPSLSTVLTNPGSTQKATIGTSTGGIDAGLTANLRIPYSQRQLDCVNAERSFVIGLDAGYRFTGRTPLNSGLDLSASNPAIQLSGWYAGIRLGFGMRVRSTTASPVTL